MSPWLRVVYAWAGRLAELLAYVIPTTASSKVAKAFTTRRGLLSRYSRWGEPFRVKSRPLLWVHASSVGEGLMALPVIRRVLEELPDVQVAYTFFSPSAERFAKQIGAHFTAYLPFDTVAGAERVLSALTPTVLLFSKLDVWPILAEQAHERGVRLGLMSASMPAGSARHGIGAMFTRGAYAAMDWIGAASADDATRLIAAGARADHVQVTGDTRYDQAWMRARRDRQHVEIVAALQSRRPTLVAGSTWPADERHLFPAWERLVKDVPAARLIIAPHEPSEMHVVAVETWANRTRLRCERLSSPSVADADVIVVDSVGVLADLYVLGDVAYVGGGFHRAGLHSVVEPAVLYKAVVIGPRNGASRDARLMLDVGGALAVGGTEEMPATFRKLLTESTEREQMARALEAVVFSQRGATARSFRAVQQLLHGEIPGADPSGKTEGSVVGAITPRLTLEP